MKISNETKVGTLTVIAITLLVLGFNFLKGKSIGSKDFKLYAVFDNIKGLANSNPVEINGKQVGTIASTEFTPDMRLIKVGINLTHSYDVPDSSIAIISKDLLGTTILEIKLRGSNHYFVNGDTISTRAIPGLLDDAMDKLDPVLYEVKNAVKALDSVLITVNNVVNPAAKNNIRNILDNLTVTTAKLSASSASLEILMNTQTGALAKTLDHINAFTGNLAQNNQKVTNVLENLDKTTAKFSNLDLDKTMNLLNSTLADVKTSMGKLSSNNGTLGLLINDTRLYNNLAATSNKLNLLLDDLRTNPKRYVNVSVFGRKDKSGPLLIPLPDTVNAPYKKP
ncbi:MAG: MlaD family protein [Ferruginibacter sp.]